MKFWKFGKTKIGTEGEILAKKFLQKKGYKIIATNYKNKLGEIDIIALEKDTLVFVEVKTRTTTRFGLAKEAVNKHKQKQIIKVAMCYLKTLNEKNLKVRFDVIAINLKNKEIEHIHNAFTL
ncbi:MAG TPA: YraN family protein [Candidatus Desulfofervidus auxilii]|uniref:UPF0102 protein ENG63_06410 n=1 Tax=Desulfofervidus auxilii TaxID=1621989 RepID=A0A7C0U2W2_DESA2|nr:YraN family protein [Candidatus Desulfofervidus auxilii]